MLFLQSNRFAPENQGLLISHIFNMILPATVTLVQKAISLNTAIPTQLKEQKYIEQVAQFAADVVILVNVPNIPEAER